MFGSDITVNVAPSNGTINTCGQDATASQTLVKVASTLAFPTDVYVPSGNSISIAPPDDIYADIDKTLFDASKAN